MSKPCSEPDWRTFRELSECAIDRFCQRALDDTVRIATDTSLSVAERLEATARLTHERRRTLDRDLSTLARSQVLNQLVVMQAHDLLEADEIARFSEEIRATLRDVAALRARSSPTA